MSMTGTALLAKAGWWIILGLAAIALGLGLMVLYQKKDVEIAEQAKIAAEGKLSQAVKVNQENTLEVAKAKGVNTGLMLAIRANTEAATRAGERIAKLTLERDAVLAQRAYERRKLGRENPKVAEYQSGVMPLPLFCSLWPEASACKN